MREIVGAAMARKCPLGQHQIRTLRHAVVRSTVANEDTDVPDCGLSMQGLYAKAEPLYFQTLAIYKETLGEKHPTYATGLNNLAIFYENQGSYSAAEPLFRQALEITKQALGEKHPDYADGLQNLANLLQTRGFYAQAEPLLRRAIEITKQVLGEKHPRYASGLNDLEELHRQADAALQKLTPLVERIPDAYAA